MEPEKQPTSPSAHCLNCSIPIEPSSKFCHQCGQKNTDGRVSFWGLVGDFFSSYFNWDSKVIRSLFHLMQPGKLTQEYFLGKHQSYVKPIQFFLFSLLIFFAVINWATKADEGGVDKGLKEQFLIYSEQDKIFVKLDSITANPESSFLRPKLDSMKQEFVDLRMANDSIQGAFNLGLVEIDIEDKIPLHEFATYDIEELLEKHEIKGFWNEMLFRQIQKMALENQEYGKYLYSKFPLMILLMMPALALILKLFYVRREKYYVEHLIFSFHVHTFLLFIFFFAILLNALFDVYFFIPIAILTFVVYLLFSLKRVYGQSWSKTIFKFFALGFLYLFLLAVFLLATTFLTLFLF